MPRLSPADEEAIACAAERRRKAAVRELVDDELVAWRAAMEIATKAERAHLLAHHPHMRDCDGGPSCPFAQRGGQRKPLPWRRR